MSNTAEKDRIRSRYKGISQDQLETIPAIEKKDIFVDDSPKRIAVYARVSTGDPRQTSSFELQQNHYTDLIERRPGWELYKIYADEGISGTSLKHRDAFKEMIRDCKAHKVDLIITKSVSRFARNIYDCIGYVRELAALKPPIGVLFETENLYTLKDDSEMALSFIATLAQEESHTKSSSMNLSYEMRFSRGIFLTPELLGYDKDEDGNLVINEDEALTVRLIFFMFLYGYTPAQIADTLMELGRITKRGNLKWTSGTVLNVLQNERHCGDVLAHKTFTPNYLNHKSVKNRGEKAQYRHVGHHEGIITRDDFITVQQMISFGMRGRTGMLPQLHVIDNGALKGFVVINPRWAGFTANDYLEAARSLQTDETALAPTVTAEAGSLDYRGFVVVRGQFFEVGRTASVTLTSQKITFSSGCLPKMNNTRYVEFLFDPIRKLLVIRPTTKDNRNSVGWIYFDGQKHHPRKLTGYGYLPVIYELMNWNEEWPYCARGEYQDNGADGFMVFDLKDAEAVIRRRNQKIPVPDEQAATMSPKEVQETILAMPQEWLSSFGSDYYSQIPTLPTGQLPAHEWNAQDAGKPVEGIGASSPRTETELREGIDTIIAAIREGSADNGAAEV